MYGINKLDNFSLNNSIRWRMLVNCHSQASSGLTAIRFTLCFGSFYIPYSVFVATDAMLERIDAIDDKKWTLTLICHIRSTHRFLYCPILSMPINFCNYVCNDTVLLTSLSDQRRLIRSLLAWRTRSIVKTIVIFSIRRAILAT